MTSSAVISECGTYRYHLQRVWDATKPRVAFCMLNGSTADHAQNDPTITRCVGFGTAWGFGGLDVVNEYGLRSTDPRNLWTHPDPIGPENDAWILRVANDPEVKLFICAWGRHGERNGRDRAVLKLLFGVPLYMIGQSSYPRHPLYLRKNLGPVLYRERL